ncbi:MAG: VOC family protein [Leptolyngbya sp. RL_3_1]|nr:VOC family protein [Leptolyngbya sp. RL_3_1]
MHHASIRTADIHQAIAFYEKLGFTPEERFTAGITLACWMTGLGGRIELLQVPEPAPTADAFHDEHYTGYYHLSFDLTDALTTLGQTLPDWLAQLQQRFAQADPPLEVKVLLPPQQQMIGPHVYEVMFIADTDGLPLEFLRMMNHGR